MLPNAERAIVEPAKVRDYLLSLEHPIGRFKARFFHSLGYTRNDWAALQDDLLHLARSGSVQPGQPSAHGRKYEVSGTLAGPNQRRGSIVSIWLVGPNEEVPRFVTAYPG